MQPIHALVWPVRLKGDPSVLQRFAFHLETAPDAPICPFRHPGWLMRSSSLCAAAGQQQRSCNVERSIYPAWRIWGDPLVTITDHQRATRHHNKQEGSAREGGKMKGNNARDGSSRGGRPRHHQHLLLRYRRQRRWPNWAHDYPPSRPKIARVQVRAALGLTRVSAPSGVLCLHPHLPSTSEGRTGRNSTLSFLSPVTCRPLA